jgi:hypothetical protein
MQDAVDEILGGAPAAIFESPAKARAVNRMEDVVVSATTSDPAPLFFEAASLALFQTYTVTVVVDMSRATFTSVPNTSGEMVVLAERLPFIIRRVIRSLAYAKHGLRRVRRDLGGWRPQIKVQILAANCPQVRRDTAPRHVTFNTTQAQQQQQQQQQQQHSLSVLHGKGSAGRSTAAAAAAAAAAAGQQQALPHAAPATSSSTTRLDVIMPHTRIEDLDSPEGLRHCDDLVEARLREYRRRALATDDVDWCDSVDMASTLERVASVTPAPAASEQCQSVVVIADLTAEVHDAVAERIVLQAHKLHRKSMLFTVVDLGYHNDFDMRCRSLDGALPRPGGHLGAFITEYMRGHIIRLPESHEEQPASSHYYRVIGLDHYTSQMTPDPQPDARLGLALTVQRLAPLQVLLVPSAAALSKGPLPHLNHARSPRVLLWESSVTLDPAALSPSTALIMAAHSRSAHGWQVVAVFEKTRLRRFDATFTARLGWGSATLLFMADGAPAADGSRSATPTIRLRTYLSADRRVLSLVQRVLLDSTQRIKPLTPTEVLLADLCALGKDLHETEASHLRICADPRNTLSLLMRSSSFSGCPTDFYSSFFVKFFTVLVQQPRDGDAVAVVRTTYDFLHEASTVLQQRGWSTLVDPVVAASPIISGPPAHGYGERGGGGTEMLGPSSTTAAAWYIRASTVTDRFINSKPLVILQAWQPRGLDGFECYPVHLRLVMPHVFLDVELLSKLQELVGILTLNPPTHPHVRLSADETDLTGATIHRLMSQLDASAILAKKERRMEHRPTETPFMSGGLLASSQTEAMWKFDAGNFASWSTYCSSFARMLIDWRLHLDTANPFKLLYLRRKEVTASAAITGGVAAAHHGGSTHPVPTKCEGFIALVWRPAARAFDGESDEAVAEYHAIDTESIETISVAHVASQQQHVPSTSSGGGGGHGDSHEKMGAREGTGCFPALDTLADPERRQEEELRRIVHLDARIIRIGRTLGALLTAPRTLSFARDDTTIPDSVFAGGNIDLPVCVRTILPVRPASYAPQRLAMLDGCCRALDVPKRAALRERLRAWVERFILTVLDSSWVTSLDSLPECVAKALGEDMPPPPTRVVNLSAAAFGNVSDGSPANSPRARDSAAAPTTFPSSNIFSIAGLAESEGGTPTPAGFLQVVETPLIARPKTPMALLGVAAHSGPVSFWFVRRGLQTTPLGSEGSSPLLESQQHQPQGRQPKPVSITVQSVTITHDELRLLCFPDERADSPILRNLYCSTRGDPEESGKRVAAAFQRVADLASAATYVGRVLEAQRFAGGSAMECGFDEASGAIKSVLARYRGQADVSHCLRALQAFEDRIGPEAAEDFRVQLLDACHIERDVITPLGDSTTLFALALPPEVPPRSESASPVHDGVHLRDDQPPLEAPPVLLSFGLSLADEQPDFTLPRDHREIAHQLLTALRGMPERLVFVVNAWTFPVPVLRWVRGGRATLVDFAAPPAPLDGSDAAAWGLDTLPSYMGDRLSALVDRIAAVANQCVVRSTLARRELVEDFVSNADTRLLRAMLPSLEGCPLRVARDPIAFASISTADDRRKLCDGLLEEVTARAQGQDVSVPDLKVTIACVTVELGTRVAFAAIAQRPEGGERQVAAIVVVRLDTTGIDQPKTSAHATLFGAGFAAALDALVVLIREWIHDVWWSAGRDMLLGHLIKTNQATDDCIPVRWGFPRAEQQTPPLATFTPRGIVVRCVTVAQTVTAAEVVNALHQTIDVMRIPNRDGCFICEDAFFRIAVTHGREEGDAGDYLPLREKPAPSAASRAAAADSPLGDLDSAPNSPGVAVSSEAGSATDMGSRTSTMAIRTTRRRQEHVDIHLYGCTHERHVAELRALVVEAHNDTVMRTMAVFQELRQVASTPKVTPQQILERCPASMTFSDEEMAILRTGLITSSAIVIPAGLDHASGESALQKICANLRNVDLYLCPTTTRPQDVLNQSHLDIHNFEGTPSIVVDSASFGNNTLSSVTGTNAPLGAAASRSALEALSATVTGAAAAADFVLLMVNGDTFISDIYSLHLELNSCGNWEVTWYCSRPTVTDRGTTTRNRFTTARDGVERAVRIAAVEMQYEAWAAHELSLSTSVDYALDVLPEDRLVAKARLAAALPPPTDAPCRAAATIYRAEKQYAHNVFASSVIPRAIETAIDGLAARGLAVDAYTCGDDWSLPRRLIGSLAWNEHRAIQEQGAPRIIVIARDPAEPRGASPAAVFMVTRSSVSQFAYHRTLRDALVGAMAAAAEQLSGESVAFTAALHRTLGIARRAAPTKKSKAQLVHQAKSSTPADSATAGGAAPAAGKGYPPLPFVPRQRIWHVVPPATSLAGARAAAIVANRVGLDATTRFDRHQAETFLDREGDLKGHDAIRLAVHSEILRRWQNTDELFCNTAKLPWARSAFIGSDFVRHTKRVREAETLTASRRARDAKAGALAAAWKRRDALSPLALAGAIATTQQVSIAFHTARVPDTELDVRQSFDAGVMGRALPEALDPRCERTLHHVNHALAEYGRYLQRRFPALIEVAVDPVAAAKLRPVDAATGAIDAAPLSASAGRRGDPPRTVEVLTPALELRLRWRYGVLRVDNETLQFQPALRYFVLPVALPATADGSAVASAGRPSTSASLPPSPTRGTRGNTSMTPSDTSAVGILAAAGTPPCSPPLPPAGFIVVELGFTLLHYVVDIHMVCQDRRVMGELIAEAEAIKEGLCFSSLLHDLMVHRFISTIRSCSEGSRNWDRVAEETRIQAVVDRHLRLHPDRPFHVASAATCVTIPSAAPQTFCIKPQEDRVQGVPVFVSGFVAPSSVRGDNTMAFYAMACVMKLHAHNRETHLDFNGLLDSVHSKLKWTYEQRATIRDGEEIWRKAQANAIDYDETHRLLRLAKQVTLEYPSRQLSGVGVDWTAACTGPMGTLYKFVRHARREWRLVSSPSGTSFVLVYAPLQPAPNISASPSGSPPQAHDDAATDHGGEAAYPAAGGGAGSGRCVILVTLQGREVKVRVAFPLFQLDDKSKAPLAGTMTEVEAEIRHVETVLGTLSQVAFASLL